MMNRPKQPQSPSTPLEQEAQSRELASARRWTAAARLMLKAARAEPDQIDRWIQAALWQRENRDAKQAVQTLRHAIKANEGPGQTGTTIERAHSQKLERLYSSLLELQLEQQDWGSCLVTCQQLIQIAPRNHFALEASATALLHSGRISQAAQAMRELLIISPRDPLHRLKYATLLQLGGYSGAALQEFSRVVSAFPDAAFADDARDAIDLLDSMQIQQILMRAAEQTVFRIQLQRTFDDTLRQYGFSLSDNGRESLRHMMDDGRIETGLRVHRLH